MSAFSFQKKEDIGNFGLLTGLAITLLAYLFGFSPLYYFSFALILISIGMMYLSVIDDLGDKISPRLIPVFSVLFLLLFYFLLRLKLLDFSFIIGDASDYFWSGVGSVVSGSNHSFFLPLSSSVAGAGYQIFGLEFAPLMTTIIYSASLPLLYFLLKNHNLL